MSELYVDKCAHCEMYFLTTDITELRTDLVNHETDVHGAVDPSRPDRRDDAP